MVIVPFALIASPSSSRIGRTPASMSRVRNCWRKTDNTCCRSGGNLITPQVRAAHRTRLEEADALVHGSRLLLERLGGRGILLDQRGVLLRHLVHLGQRL